MRARVLTIALVVAGLAAPGSAGAALRSFKMPSKRIFCLYSSGSGNLTQIRCDVTFLNDVGFTIGRSGKGHRIHPTDTVADPGAGTLAYGTSRRFGVFTCTSRTSGLTCRNRKTHHGFALSREHQRLF